MIIKNKTNLYMCEFESEFGTMLTIASDTQLYLLLKKNSKNIDIIKEKILSNSDVSPIKEKNDLIKKIEFELMEYCEGKRTNFDIGLNLQGSDFQKKVWNELINLDYGQDTTYSNICSKINSKAYRAVGNAVGANPIQVIIPCHRVLRTDGGIGGFSGGLDMKVKLLNIEGIDHNIF
ncbi:methylated-DNA--[protein]-cysteine S-methyltransferase [Peptostreptococcus equinus]|uniref:Methylated-DNA--[protein]-cysteine S-methyltransferase n=1 Tax=Peptostreptococcus equinus TaxID=3003601 RepID=A0ABY7JS71_9FIRM|nr:methylated-DNA--[protein]-cysteine S-methyltransferase [Peptostreptococcus sp. CBA3647]WAW15329.1 methylated-DNA--[protein]-cysteine S-methyltransferase [Peptostreptococcus sp. CBA3647]